MEETKNKELEESGDTIRNELKRKTSTLLKYRGNDSIIDRIVDHIQSNLDLSVQQAMSNSLTYHTMIEGLDELDLIFNDWIKHKDDSQLMRVKDAIQNIAESIVSTMSEDTEIHIALGQSDNLIPFYGLNNLFVVECSYLRNPTFQDIFELGHEVGHIVHILYGIDQERSDYLINTMMRNLSQIDRNLDGNISEKYAQLLCYYWLGEFVADAVSLLRIGPEAAIRHFEATQREKYPLMLGGDTHPPDALRLQFIRERCIRTVGGIPKMSSFIAKLRDLKTPSNYIMADESFLQRANQDPKYNNEVLKHLSPSLVPSELALSKNTIKVLSSLVDEILEWGKIESNLEQIKNSYLKIMQGITPQCDSGTLYGAYLSVARKKPGIDFADLISE